MLYPLSYRRVKPNLFRLQKRRLFVKAKSIFPENGAVPPFMP